MPGPKTQKQIFTDDNSAIIERLARVETQLSYFTKSSDDLTKTIRDSETKREEQWERYVREHEKVVQDCDGNTEKLGRLETAVNTLAVNTARDIKDMYEKIGPILFAHKILVWVAGALGLSVVALIWGILTHTIQIVSAAATLVPTR